MQIMQNVQTVQGIETMQTMQVMQEGGEGAAVRKMYSRPAVPQHRAKARGCNTLSGVITRISWSK